jgi:hypothetical protein
MLAHHRKGKKGRKKKSRPKEFHLQVPLCLQITPDFSRAQARSGSLLPAGSIARNEAAQWAAAG